MRKHISVFMLMVRSCVYKLLLVLLAMTVAEIAIFYLLPEKESRLLFDTMDSGGIFFVYLAAVALCAVIQLGVCTDSKSQTRYTLARLSVSEKTVMAWHWLSAAMCFLIVWAWQIILFYVFARWHQATANADMLSHQSVYLATFRSVFLHSLLPLEDISRFVRNIVMAISMGGVCAAAAFKLRRGKKAGFGPAMLAALFAGTFRAEHFEISYDGFIIFAFIFVTVISMVGVFAGDAEVDYEEVNLEN